MFRRYNRWHARFDQPDPYDGSYREADPQSFNRYAYTRNDPVNFVDPMGLDGPPDNRLCFGGNRRHDGMGTINVLSGDGSALGGGGRGGNDFFLTAESAGNEGIGGEPLRVQGFVATSEQIKKYTICVEKRAKRLARDWSRKINQAVSDSVLLFTIDALAAAIALVIESSVPGGEVAWGPTLLVSGAGAAGIMIYAVKKVAEASDEFKDGLSDASEDCKEEAGLPPEWSLQ